MQSGDVQWVRSRQPGTVGPLRLVRRLFPEHAPPPGVQAPRSPAPASGSAHGAKLWLPGLHCLSTCPE